MSEWMWHYEGHQPEQEMLREALCTLGNGYLATRGATTESHADAVHYPATYVAGCYDRAISTVAGRRVENEDLVNLPNWLCLRLRPRSRDGEAGRWFSPEDCEVLDYRRTLDLRRGILTFAYRYRDPMAGVVRVRQQRVVHMADPHLVASRTRIAATEWSGSIELESALDGDVSNDNVARYRRFQGRHLIGVDTGTALPDTMWLRCRTAGSDIAIGMAARTRALRGGLGPPVCGAAPPRVSQRVLVPVGPGQAAVVDKIVAVHTSRDRAISEPLAAAIDHVGTVEDFSRLLPAHTEAWARLWRHARLDVPGEVGRVLRLQLFHVLQTLSPNTVDLDVGVPARGLHGEAYRGHVFWDELFVLPYMNLHFPEISRAMLEYRYRRLPMARRMAAEAGRRGAMYPWQSGSDGREESQRVHLNPRSGRWVADHSRLQRHVGSAIAYNVWRYAEATGDTTYLHGRGAEMLLGVAQFWADSLTFDSATRRYHIRGVVGPDEYHDSYPAASRPGIDDNAYTNVTAAWVLATATALVERLPEWRREELFALLRFDQDDLARWVEVSRRLYVPFRHGVIEQFAGYGELAELDWDRYRDTYTDIRRLDRILEAEGDTTNRYQVSKQADVLMLGYLYTPTELAELFRRLEYELTDDVWRATVDYYLARTCHGSTLSGLVHAWVLARSRPEWTWRFAHEALSSDVADLQGGTTGEGIHLGAMAGSLDLVQRGLTGIRAQREALYLDPAPPPQLSEYGFSLRYHEHTDVDVTIHHDELRISVPDSKESPIRVALPDRAITIAPGETYALALIRPGQGPTTLVQTAARVSPGMEKGPQGHGEPAPPGTA